MDWLKLGIYTGSSHKAVNGNAQWVTITSKLAATNSTSITPSPHAKFSIKLQGIQPNGTDGNALSSGDWWHDPWAGHNKQA